MLAPILMTIDWIVLGAKTTRQRGFCHRHRWGDQFLPGVPPMQNKPTRPGNWKWAMDKLWEDGHQRYQAVACQQLLDKKAAHQQQDAACCQQLLDKHTAQYFLDKHAARPEGRRSHKLSSSGFAAAASMSGLPNRLHGDSNVRPLLPACNTT
jgi:hypothetical protein